MTAFRLLTIDLDDTVWPCAPVIRKAEEVLYRWLVRRAPRLAENTDPAALREHRKRLMSRRRDIAHDLTALRLVSLQTLLGEFGYPQELALEGLKTFLKARNQVDPYPDVAPVLAGLAHRCHLVSLTNGNADVERTPLRGHFHLALNAAEVGAAKPSPRMFQRAMDIYGTRAEQAAHVGDDPWLDVEAARQAGMYTVWINRRGAAWPTELPAPELELSDFHGLLGLVTGAVE